MSGFEESQAFVFPGGEQCIGMTNTEFGGFSPETEAGAELLSHLGRSGLFGQWLVGQLTAEAARQNSETNAKAMAASVSTSYRPAATDINHQWLVMHASAELGAVDARNEHAAALARQNIAAAERQLVEEGLATASKAKAMVIGARQEAHAQLN